MEALAKGAMRFSRKFTVRELRERWRALLYDPEIAAQAASRMVEAEAALSNLPPNTKTLNEHRNTKVLARKRRARSIRSLYYKKRKRMAAEKLVAAVMLENELESDFMTGDEMAEDIVHGEQGGALQPILPSGLEDKSLPGGLLSPKEPTTDFEEPTFSEMVSLLAAGECQHSGHCKMPIYAFTCVFLSCCKVSGSGVRILFLHSGLL
jgi:microspherule protein 1